MLCTAGLVRSVEIGLKVLGEEILNLRVLLLVTAALLYSNW
jgi:hypothetical protein